ncbi:hypothetical protein FQN49_001640 [Arthroderma sp. PD_2]|nr:hypothetical protein FQN49_001640 [Arthroderma sp. PD_2]
MTSSTTAQNAEKKHSSRKSSSPIRLTAPPLPLKEVLKLNHEEVRKYIAIHGIVAPLPMKEMSKFSHEQISAYIIARGGESPRRTSDVPLPGTPDLDFEMDCEDDPR